MDEPENPQPAGRKRKLGKTALEKLKASQKAKAKKKAGVDDDNDSDDDEYTALSKSLKANISSPSARPPVGTLEECVECEKQFSVVSCNKTSRSVRGHLRSCLDTLYRCCKFTSRISLPHLL